MDQIKAFASSSADTGQWMVLTMLVGAPWISVRDLVIYTIIFTLSLPEVCMIFKAWREIVLKFVSDDDGKLNKADLKDGAINWSATLLVRIPLVAFLIAYADGHEVNELFVGECFGTACALWGINRFAPAPTPKEEKPSTT